MIATTPVVAAPIPFIVAFRRHPPPRWRNQWRTIPACARVNAVKTPITYRWISEFTFALNATIKPEARPASTTIPFE